MRGMCRMCVCVCVCVFVCVYVCVCVRAGGVVEGSSLYTVRTRTKVNKGSLLGTNLVYFENISNVNYNIIKNLENYLK